jgi:hypothetical protein
VIVVVRLVLLVRVSPSSLIYQHSIDSLLQCLQGGTQALYLAGMFQGFLGHLLLLDCHQLLSLKRPGEQRHGLLFVLLPAHSLGKNSIEELDTAHEIGGGAALHPGRRDGCLALVGHRRLHGSSGL